MKDKKEVKKCFPADVDILNGKVTFLTDKKVDAELYAYLMQMSYGQKQEDGKGITVLYKSSIPPQSQICRKLGYGSRTTFRKHFDYLVEKNYLIDRGPYYEINCFIESIYFEVNIDTIIFLNDTVKEDVWKAYLYLGQRWKWKKSDFVFTLDDLGEHIGMKPNNNSKVYETLRNILTSLENNGLIKVVEFREGIIPKRRLIEFNFKHKTPSKERKEAAEQSDV